MAKVTILQISLLVAVSTILLSLKLEQCDANPTDVKKQDLLENWWKAFSTSWPRYEATKQILQDMESSFPDQVKIYSIGKTVQGREMWVIKLGQDVQKGRSLLVPPMKIVANMHGDETLGRALMLMLAVDILKGYHNHDSRANHLLENTEIHLMPSMNADGYEAAPEGSCDPDSDAIGRVNAHKQDLNRNFPDQFETKGMDMTALLKGREPETINMMKWITTNFFVLSANLHALTLVASYPFDSVPLEKLKDPTYKGEGVISRSPDHELFFYLATMYATSHKTMSKYNNCSKGEFKNGVVNGAEWYNVRGGMQDFNYIHANTFDITFELSCCKFPPAYILLQEWDNNKEALWKYVEATQMGVKGLVTDSNGKAVGNAKIHVDKIDHLISTTPNGEYWRLLLPGNYKIWVEADGYKNSEKVDVHVDEKKIPARQDFKLSS